MIITLIKMVNVDALSSQNANYSLSNSHTLVDLYLFMCGERPWTLEWIVFLLNFQYYLASPFKTQVLVYFDREITKIWFASLSMFSNFWPIVISVSNAKSLWDCLCYYICIVCVIVFVFVIVLYTDSINALRPPKCA